MSKKRRSFGAVMAAKSIRGPFLVPKSYDWDVLFSCGYRGRVSANEFVVRSLALEEHRCESSSCGVDELSKV